MRKALTLLIAILCANMALAQNKPLACQVDAAAGLKWENGQWKVTRFLERKFILVMRGDTLTKESVASSYPNFEDIPKNLISSVFCETDKYDKRIRCSMTRGHTLLFNPENNRGGISLLGGAASSGTDDRDTPSVEAFTCQPY